jgi:hypothetical protein
LGRREPKSKAPHLLTAADMGHRQVYLLPRPGLPTRSKGKVNYPALIWSDRVKFRDAHLGLLLLVKLFEDRAGSGRSSLCDG